MQRFDILGVPVDDVTMTAALEFVDACVCRPSQPACIVCANPEKVYTLRANAGLRPFFRSADLVIADGVGFVLAARILNGRKLDRIAGADLMQSICSVAPARGYRIFLYGGSPYVNRRAAEILEQRHPGIQVVGREHGFVPAGEIDKVIERINATRPDILFVALGSPRQELWIQENIRRLNVKVIEGIGGTLDVIAGTVRRAPLWMQAIGLEWFFRLLRQPSRARRQLNLVRFVAELIVLRAGGSAA